MGFPRRFVMSQSGLPLSAQLPRLVAEHVQALVTAVTAAVRSSIAEEVAALIGAGSPAGIKLALGGKLPRILPCRAPGCKKASKGPRFHFLCEDHRGASAKQIESWRQAAAKADAAAKAEDAARLARLGAIVGVERPRILPCIAPGCGKPSKGPRFHFLCEDHRDAPKREWTAWKKAHDEKR
jgi:hypothetical protein